MIVFLGSGVSRTTGLPGVEGMMGAILRKGWSRHTDYLFYPYSPDPHELMVEDPASSVQRFLRHVTALADAVHASRGLEQVNYEDLFSLLKQIVEHEQGAAQNSALEPYVATLRNQVGEFPIHQAHADGHASPLAALAEMGIDLIQCAVHWSLSTSKPPIGLDLVEDITRKVPATIVTLNHDLLIERVLENAGVKYRDGFGDRDGDFRWFEEQRLAPEDSVRLIKLHGSINWYEMSDPKNRDRGTKTAILAGEDPWHHENREGIRFDNWSGTPLFLTGVGNKVAAYNSGIYAEMMFRFHEALKSTDSIVMSGYGWGDKGINVRLIDWLLDSEKRRLFLLNERPEEFVEKQTALTHRRNWLKEQGRLIEIRKWMSDTTVKDLLENELRL